MTEFDESIPPPPRPVEYRGVDTRGWWAVLLAGVALVLVGLWMLTNPFESVTVLAILTGVSLIAGGFVEAGFTDDAGLGWAGWLAGALLVVAGAVVLVWPDITLWALAVAAGAALLATGLLHALWALSRRDRPDWAAHLALGVLGALVGVVVLSWPEATLVVLALLIGIRALATGVVAIAAGWQLHRLSA